MPGTIKNMVTVDHDLSGGVISSLCPKNGDDTREIHSSATNDDEETNFTTEESPSNTLLEMTPEDKPQISTVDFYLPIEEGMELAESELEPCLGQLTSNSPKEDFQSIPLTPPSHEPERVVIQGWFAPNNKTLSISKEEENLSDKDNETIWMDEASEEEEEDFSQEDNKTIRTHEASEEGDETKTIGTVLPEQEEESMDLPDKLQIAALEAQLKLEAKLPDSVKKLLGLLIVPVVKPTMDPSAEPKEDLSTSSTGALGLRDAI